VRRKRQRGSACCQMQKLSAGKFHCAPYLLTVPMAALNECNVG